MVDSNTDAITYTSPTNSRWIEVESFLRGVNDNIYYDMTGEKYMIIFNNYEFKKTRYFGYERPQARTGTMEDVTKLTKLFDDLGYKVLVYIDLDYIDIIEKLRLLTIQDHKSTSCLCFAFLSHGSKDGQLCAADRPYHFQEITDMFECSHPSLVGKPKIIFVQSCRGHQVDTGRRLEFDGSHMSCTIPTHADLFVLYSSVDEYVSFRSVEGSYMIQDLCDVIREFHKVGDILHISTLVHKKVAAREAYKRDISKQMPETRNSLTKFFKF